MKNPYLFASDAYLIRSGLIKEKMPPQRIKNIRKAFGLTQVKFAELLGINYDTLRSWEGGYRYPSSPGCALLVIAEASPEEFIRNKERIINKINKEIREALG
jgi:transcriptional regulator with XRE-family HTH domain